MASEHDPQSPEQAKVEAKRYEAHQLARLGDILFEMLHGEIGPDAADGAADFLHQYCVSVAKRDEAMGRLMIRAMEAHEKARQLDISTAMRRALDLPVSTYPDYPPIEPIRDPYDQPPSAPDAQP